MAVLSSQPVTSSAEAKKRAMTQILAAYRRKIRRVYPLAEFEDDFVLDCSIESFASYLEQQFGTMHSWESYGRTWQVTNKQSRRGLDLTNARIFYDHFHHTSYRVDPLPGEVRGFRAVPGTKHPVDRMTRRSRA